MKPKVIVPYIELMNVLNRAQELCILDGVTDENRQFDCIEELKEAMGKLNKICPDLPIDAEVHLKDVKFTTHIDKIIYKSKTRKIELG